MASPLISTKLHVPIARQRVVDRSRLRALLDRGANAKVTLVSAPAGFGKTTLLAQWLAGPVPNRPAIAWLSRSLNQETAGSVSSNSFKSLTTLRKSDPVVTAVLDKAAPRLIGGKAEDAKKLAFDYLQQRAVEGDERAQLWTAYCYREGIGTGRDSQQSREWYQKAYLQSSDEEVKERALAGIAVLQEKGQ